MIFFRFFLLIFFLAKSSFAALPFVTDDAAIADLNSASIEAFSEKWHLPKKGDNPSAELFGQYLGLSYGLRKNLEVTVGSLAGYDLSDHRLNLMNPILQLKTMVFTASKPAIPSIAVSAAYINKSGRGQYYDQATDAYLMGIATSKFFDEDWIIHVNAGPKASYNIASKNDLYRLHLGIASDAAFFRKDVRLFVESFNGAPNSPRDSPGFFRSYQAGFKFIKSTELSFHILYGSQPTFAGYDDGGTSLYRRTNWVQFGVRKVIGEVF